MTEIKVVNSTAEIPVLPGWKNLEIGSQHTFVTQFGRDFDPSSYGIRYRLLSVKERKHGIIERIARISFGVFITAISLGLALFSHNIRNLFSENPKRILYITPANKSSLALDLSVEHIQLLVKKIFSKLQVNPATALKPSELCTITEAKKAYEKELSALQINKSSEDENRFMLGNTFSNKKKKLQDCINKISEIMQLAHRGNNWHPANDLAHEYNKKSLREIYINDTRSFKFQKLIHYSLQDPTALSHQDMQKFARVEGTKNFSPELFFEEQLQNFYRSATLNDDEKSACNRVVKAFEFCKIMGWQGVKARRLHNKSWYKVKAGATFQSAVRNMKSGEEIAFPSIHQAKLEDYGHATFFAIGKRPDGNYTCSLYNTGLGSLDSPLDRNKKIVEQAHFTPDAILSDQFSSIVTDELLNFNGSNALSDQKLFDRYTNFKSRHQIALHEIGASPEKPKLIHGQVVGNCGVASQIGYIQETLGANLFDKFKRFVLRGLRLNHSHAT